jgi:hypothetical protein
LRTLDLPWYPPAQGATVTAQLGPAESHSAFLARCWASPKYGFKAKGDEMFYDGSQYRWCDGSNLGGSLAYEARKAQKASR